MDFKHKNMKQILIFVLFFSFGFSQKVIVKFKFKINNDFLSTSKNFTLKQDDNASIFEIDDEKDEKQVNDYKQISFKSYLEKDSISIFSIGDYGITSIWKEKNFKNFKENFQIHNYKNFKTILYVKDSLEVIKWNLIEKSDTIIAYYNCKKATAKFRGRDYLAYYTSEIANQGGPYKFDGLPGFIVKVKSIDGYLDISPTEISVPKIKTNNIYNPFKGKELILFKELKDKIIEDERKMFEKFKLDKDIKLPSLVRGPFKGIEDVGLNYTREYK